MSWTTWWIVSNADYSFNAEKATRYRYDNKKTTKIYWPTDWTFGPQGTAIGYWNYITCSILNMLQNFKRIFYVLLYLLFPRMQKNGEQTPKKFVWKQTQYFIKYRLVLLFPKAIHFGMPLKRQLLNFVMLQKVLIEVRFSTWLLIQLQRSYTDFKWH